MRLLSSLAAASMCGLVVLTGAISAETKVEVKEVHLCCPACVKGVGAALKPLDGVKPTCDRENGTVTIVAPDAETAQKALDALAAAGYHGTPDNAALKFKIETNVPAGKVKTLSLSGIHNCCGACNSAIKNAVKNVEGVTGNTVVPKKGEFEVTGDFDAAAVVKALNTAGFHVQIKN
jgi:periplasmic mercuric ion binding protein